ncbi:MAG: hypothetical protein RLO52_22245 [Sandaracinaceae bacterium]
MPGAGAHTISRFVDRRFHIVDDEDLSSLIDAIERADDRWDWTCLSFAAMSSHIHYGHLAGERDPDPFFRSVNTRFAVRYHRRPGRETLGPVFAGRPVIHAVKESMLPRMVAYHHRNVVEAGMVDLARDSRRTSHRAYLRLDPAPPWLDVERGLELLGFHDTAAGRRRFDEFVNEVDLSDFLEDAHEAAKVRETCGRSGARDVDWARLIELARRVAGVPDGEPLSSRRPATVNARTLVGLVGTRRLQQSYPSVARAIGMSPSGVSNLLARKAADPRIGEMYAVLTSVLDDAVRASRVWVDG